MKTLYSAIVAACLSFTGCDGVPNSVSGDDAVVALPTGTMRILPVHSSAAQTRTYGSQFNVPAFDGMTWRLGTSRVEVYYPAPIVGDDQITEWALFGRREAIQGSGANVTAQLVCLEAVSLLEFPVGPAVTNSDDVRDSIVVTTKLSPPEFAHEDCTYALRVLGGGIAGDKIGSLNMYVERQ
jgi:hypothetical protein